jgi:hypothetical protein
LGGWFVHVETLSLRRSGSDMVRWIEHIREPRKLQLVWQAPDEKKDRTRRAVGEIFLEGSTYVLRYYRNTPDVNRALELSYQGYPAFDIRQELHSRDVLAAFMRRLPPRSRADFPEYLRGLRIKSDAKVSDFALLGYSEAKLPGDGFSLVDTLEDAEVPSELLLDVAGYRHQDQKLSAESIGKMVRLEPEPTNKFDSNAIQIMLEGGRIGYVNKLQTPTVSRWLQTADVSAFVEKLNGRVDWPRAYIFLQVSEKST